MACVPNKNDKNELKSHSGTQHECCFSLNDMLYNLLVQDDILYTEITVYQARNHFQPIHLLCYFDEVIKRSIMVER